MTRTLISCFDCIIHLFAFCFSDRIGYKGNRPTTSIPAAGSPEFFRQRLYSRQCWLNSEHEYKDGQGHGECCLASVPANLPNGI